MIGGFIEVEKISELIKRGEDGKVVFNPISKQPLIEDYETKVEIISTAEIKSFRAWRKNTLQQDAFKGEVCIIYFKSPHEKFRKNKHGEDVSSIPSILINESIESFSNRLGTIKLPDGHKEASLGRE